MVLTQWKIKLIALSLGSRSSFYVEAFKWLKKAAEQGHVDAQCNLARMYDKGLGVEQDQAEALKWFQKALCK